MGRRWMDDHQTHSHPTPPSTASAIRYSHSFTSSPQHHNRYQAHTHTSSPSKKSLCLPTKFLPDSSQVSVLTQLSMQHCVTVMLQRCENGCGGVEGGRRTGSRHTPSSSSTPLPSHHVSAITSDHQVHTLPMRSFMRCP